MIEERNQELAFLEAFEKTIRESGFTIGRRTPMVDDGYIYRIDKPGTDYHYNYGVSQCQLAEGAELGRFIGGWIVFRFCEYVEDIRLLTNPSR